MCEEAVADIDWVRSCTCNERSGRKPGMVRADSEERREVLSEPAIEWSTRVVEVDVDAVWETPGFVREGEVSSSSGWGLSEGGAEAPE